MSLINKMLQDLESRSNTRENTVNKKNAYEGLKPVKAARFRTPPRRLMVMIFAVLLIGAGVYVWLQWGERLFSDNLVAMGKTQPVTVRKAVPKPAAMVAATPVPPAVAPAIPVAASAPAAAVKQEKLPAGTQIAPVAPAPTPVVEAKKETPSVSSQTPAASEPKSIPSDGYWTVSRGETLYGISTKTGIDLWDLSKWNHLGRNHVVHVGQRLRLTPPASAAAKADMNQSVNKPNAQKAAKKKEKVFVASADSSVIDGAAAAPEQNSADMAVMDKKLKPLSTDEKSEDEYRVGINFLQQGRSSDAEKHLRLAVTANAEHVKARELLAGLALQSGHVQEAEQLLEQGIAKVPAHYPFAQLLARVYVDHGSEPKALAVMEASRKAGAASAEYMAFLAALYQRAGKHAEAVKAYSDAVTLNPQESRSWLGMGISLEATQDWNGAGAAYQHAIDAGTLDSKLLQYAQQRLQIVKNK